MSSVSRRLRSLAVLASCAFFIGACSDAGNNASSPSEHSHTDASRYSATQQLDAAADTAFLQGNDSRPATDVDVSDTAMPTTEPSSSQAPLPQHSAKAGLTALGDADAAAKSERVEAPSQLAVTHIRIGSHDGFDRVVFEFAGQGDPGWFIDYTTSPRQQGSGKAIDVKGEAVLDVNIDGTVRPEEVDESLDPVEIEKTTEDMHLITDVVSSGLFEKRSQYLIGLRSETPYSVEVLRGPTRLVIDIMHSSNSASLN